MGISDNAKKVGFAIQLAWFAVMAVILIVVGIGYLQGDIRPAPAPVEEVIDYDQLYRNCMDSIKDYPSAMYDNAAENCAMIGSTAP
jgi:hypothetical protein